jgi:hypothetical protein
MGVVVKAAVAAEAWKPIAVVDYFVARLIYAVHRGILIIAMVNACLRQGQNATNQIPARQDKFPDAERKSKGYRHLPGAGTGEGVDTTPVDHQYVPAVVTRCIRS